MDNRAIVHLKVLISIKSLSPHSSLYLKYKNVTAKWSVLKKQPHIQKHVRKNFFAINEGHSARVVPFTWFYLNINHPRVIINHLR